MHFYKATVKAYSMQVNSRETLTTLWPSSVPAPDLQPMALMMDAYFALLPTCNITAHKTPERFALYNIIDSILPLQKGLMSLPEGARVADIGTGGGFPGVPLSLLCPQVSFHLFDSVGKKLRVIDAVCEEQGITNVQTFHTRLEEYGQGAGRAYYDVVTSRAVAHWTTLLELALPLLKVGGTLYAYQGEKIFDDLRQHEKVALALGGQVEETTSYTLSEDAGERYIVKVTKVRPTPKAYPRSFATMKKDPLEARHFR